ARWKCGVPLRSQSRRGAEGSSRVSADLSRCARVSRTALCEHEFGDQDLALVKQEGRLSGALFGSELGCGLLLHAFRILNKRAVRVDDVGVEAGSGSGDRRIRCAVLAV